MVVVSTPSVVVVPDVQALIVPVVKFEPLSETAQFVVLVTVPVIIALTPADGPAIDELCHATSLFR